MSSKMRRTLLMILAAAVCLGLIILMVHMQQNRIGEEKLKVTVLKVGKADAIVLQSAGKAMVIDTGEADDSEKIVKFLKEAGITDIDAMIITHFDKDHVGSAGAIAEQFNVGRVLVPDYEGSGEEYESFMNAMKAAMIELEPVKDPLEFSFGETTVKIEPPLDYDVELIADAVEDFDNTMSLMTTVTCGEKKFLFAGDADRRRIKEWLSNTEVGHVDFLKVPHHGLFNAELEHLLEVTTPDYAAITCSKKNPADETTLEMLVKHGVNVFQTRDGVITAATDGTKIDIRLN